MIKYISFSFVILQILREFISNCLTKANEKRFHSLAFPALGTGNLNFPPEIAANTFLDEVQSYASCNPQSTLRLVIVAILPTKGQDDDIRQVSCKYCCVYVGRYRYLRVMNRINVVNVCLYSSRDEKLRDDSRSNFLQKVVGSNIKGPPACVV